MKCSSYARGCQCSDCVGWWESELNGITKWHPDFAQRYPDPLDYPFRNRENAARAEVLRAMKAQAVSVKSQDAYTAALVGAKLPPMHCKKCNHYNDYVGPEHLTDLGVYICRSCKVR